MADWPSVPLEGDLAAGLDGNVGTVALALLVANDGGSAKAVRGDEAVVKVVGLPSVRMSQCMFPVQFVQSHLPYGGGNGGLVLESSVPALVFLAVGNDLVDVAVGCHKGREKEEEREHVDGIRSE